MHLFFYADADAGGMKTPVQLLLLLLLLCEGMERTQKLRGDRLAGRDGDSGAGWLAHGLPINNIHPASATAL